MKSFLEGLRIVKKALPYSRITIAVSADKTELLKIIDSHVLPDDNITVRRVSDKYPQGSEPLLLPAALGIEYPYGFNAINIGVLVISVQTVLSVYDAVTSGLPVISRVVALGGTGFLENVHVEVPVGTPWKAVIEKFGKTDREYRFVTNSLLTGEALEELENPVTVKDFALYAIPEARETGLVPFAAPGFFNDSFSNTFPPALFPMQKKLDTNIHGEGRACISCSFCADACPVGILPNLLHRYVLREIVEESLVQFGIFTCIDCNLCTYVCPSKIPVADLIKKGKQLLTEEGLGNEEESKATFALKGI
jgi:Na+-translocating ferredoxin:NAD+ oxidoreductase RnfC subunit